MDENNSIQLFEDRKIRTAWDEEKEEWYFSVVDVVAALSDSANPTDYLKKMRKRDEQLASYLGTNCPQVEMTGSTGKKRKVLAANTEQILRIIQSIPSPKAEPFRLWLAAVGRERIEETIDPEQAIDRALETYLKKGYSEDWIHQRILSIRVRNELTAEWQQRGVEKGREYAILTDEITKAWSGMTTRQYKNLKGLKKENLRDNMSTTEIILNMLAETSTKDISAAEKPDGFKESVKVAQQGGEVAGIARKALEARTGKPVVTSQNAAQLNAVVTDVIQGVAEADKPNEDEK
jgi:prophage antirepressor-like protein